MASTWSSLKFELIGTGEQAGTWGTTTNANLGDAIEQAIGGKADITMSTTSETLTLTDTTALQDARALYLNLSGTPGGAATLNVPAVEKAYIVNNGTNQQVTVKVTGQTGVVVPVGKVMALYDNGTDVVDTITHLTSLTLGSALPVTSGGTGITSFGTGVATALGQNVTGSGSIVLDASPTLTTPNLGTPSAATLTNATGLPLSTGVTGTLPLANGGTGAALTDPNDDRILFWDDSAGAVTFLSTGTGVSISGTTLSATGSGGTVTSVDVSGGTTGLTTSGGPVTSSGTITLAGTLAVANGGTGITSFGTGVATALGTAVNTTGGYVTQGGTLTANNVLLGGGSGTAISSSSLLATSAAVTSGTYIKAIGYADTVVALGNTGAAINLDVVSGGVFTATLTGNATITLRYPVSSGSSSFTLILTNDGTAGRTVAWSGGTFKFPGGAASLSRTTTANAIDVWVFFTPDGGTTYYGNIAMKNMTT